MSKEHQAGSERRREHRGVSYHPELSESFLVEGGGKHQANAQERGAETLSVGDGGQVSW